MGSNLTHIGKRLVSGGMAWAIGHAILHLTGFYTPKGIISFGPLILVATGIVIWLVGNRLLPKNRHAA